MRRYSTKPITTNKQTYYEANLKNFQNQTISSKQDISIFEIIINAYYQNIIQMLRFQKAKLVHNDQGYNEFI